MKRTLLILSAITMLSSTMHSQDTNEGEFKVRNQTTKSESKKKKSDDTEGAFKKGNIVITAGYGFPNLYKNIYKGLISTVNSINSIYYQENYSYSVKGMGPAFFKADYGLSKLIGLGVVAGYFNTSITQTRSYQVSEYNSSTSTYQYVNYEDVTKYEMSSFSVGARINFHFGRGEKLDPYAGVGVGYSLNQYKQTQTTNNPNAILERPYSGTGIPTYFAITVGMRYYFTPNIGIYGEVGFDKWSLVQGGLVAKF